jgi:succinate-semialdehyde dehydrogenase/glutarate-semialdehyde dehydrogenase
MAISETLLSKLTDRSLVTDKALIDGEWHSESDSRKRFDISNPSTGEIIASLPDMGRAETARAITAAHGLGRARLARSVPKSCAGSSTWWSPMPTISPSS